MSWRFGLVLACYVEISKSQVLKTIVGLGDEKRWFSCHVSIIKPLCWFLIPENLRYPIFLPKKNHEIAHFASGLTDTARQAWCDHHELPLEEADFLLGSRVLKYEDRAVVYPLGLVMMADAIWKYWDQWI